MRISVRALMPLALSAVCLLVAFNAAVRSSADSKADPKADLKPDVAALLQKSTDIYKKMKSYEHVALYAGEWKISPTVTRRGSDRFVLALDRPNRFCYKCDTKAIVAAVCDGKSFINFRPDQDSLAKLYTKSDAPQDYKGINIVDDVNFEPLGTYVIALMLQGDALADKDVRNALEKATLRAGVTEDGKKWDILSMPFGDPGIATDIYFGADDHLIGKTVEHSDVTITETIDNVKIDKTLDAAVFQFTLPEDAKQIDKFPAPQPENSAQAGSKLPRRLADVRSYSLSK